MAEYRISGVWKNESGTITHYAVHERVRRQDGTFGIRHAIKMTKAATIELLDKPINSARTFLWNYQTASWYLGGDIHIVDSNQRFLRTNHDNQIKDNLSHLPDYGYIFVP